MFDFVINYWAVLVSGITAFVIGGLWYSPLMFSNIWAKEAGWTKEAMDAAKNKKMHGAYLTQFVLALVKMFVLAFLVSALNISDFAGALQLAFWIWFGFELTGMIGSMLWENKSWKYVAINAGHGLVNLIVGATILAYWR